MIDKFELDKMMHRAKESKARVAVYDQIVNLALEQAEASLKVSQLGIFDAWTDIAAFYMAKIASETNELKKVNDILEKMREES